jgi:hypothetical protein
MLVIVRGRSFINDLVYRRGGVSMPENEYPAASASTRLSPAAVP